MKKYRNIFNLLLKTSSAGRLVVIIISFAAVSSLQAAPEVLIKSGKSWDGGKIAYPKGSPEITSVKLSLPAGKEGPFHCHPVPTMGYISKGTVEVETSGGKKSVFKQGQSVVEVMNTVHRGLAIGGPAEIIVFYAGDKSTPTTVFPDKDPKAYCHK